MSERPPLLFALSASRDRGEAIARAGEFASAEHIERDFEDGEHKVRPVANVRNRDAFVVQSLYGDDKQSPNDKLMRLLVLCGAIRDAGAARVTAVCPYLCYARKDRRTKARDPITTRYLGRMFSAVGIDGVLTVDVHNLAAFENAFGGSGVNLQADLGLDGPLSVVSPDAGGVKRADKFRAALASRLGVEPGRAFLEKQRSRGEVTGDAVVGDVQDAVCLVIDDLIASGTTLVRAADACRERGARAVYAAATHGLFVKDANEKLGGSALDGILVTDSVPPFRLEPAVRDAKLTVVQIAPLLADAINRLHDGGDLESLIVYT
jgi:ribose-phosphate pyrophosphokinase